MPAFLTWVLRLFSRKLARELEGEVTDAFVELLLRGMKLAFWLLPDFRRNLRGFRGRYLLETADGAVQVSAVFEGGRMKVRDDAIADWDVKVSFENPQAVWSFLLSKDQDILNSILRDEVAVEGNINYVYKLGYMARELAAVLGLSPDGRSPAQARGQEIAA
jgi:hypothetical protein